MEGEDEIESDVDMGAEDDSDDEFIPGGKKKKATKKGGKAKASTRGTPGKGKRKSSWSRQTSSIPILSLCVTIRSDQKCFLPVSESIMGLDLHVPVHRDLLVIPPLLISSFFRSIFASSIRLHLADHLSIRPVD